MGVWDGPSAPPAVGAQPATAVVRGYPPLPDDVQEDPMHPELFMRIYAQQERELEQRLLRRLAAQGRSSAGASAGHHARTAHFRAHRRAVTG